MRPASTFTKAIAVALAIFGLIIGSVAPLAAEDWSPPRTVWVSSAGHTIDGYFLDLWRAYPELLGQPITEEWESPVAIEGYERDDRYVQYFDNLAIVYVPEESRVEWQVQTLPLGKAAFDRDSKELADRSLPKSANCGSLAATACKAFDTTKHTIRNRFLTYWNEHDGARLIGAPLTEEFLAQDGYTTQYFEKMVLRWKAGADLAPRAIGSESATLQKLPIEPIAQPNAIPVYDENLFVEPVIDPADVVAGGEPVVGVGAMDVGPGPQQGGDKEIVVSVGRQSMWAYQDGKLVTASLVSTGTASSIATTTPVGYYTILAKFQVQTMQGVIDDEAYKVPDVPWVMYFDNLGNALHGTYWHENFGAPMSHGCINLPMNIAEYLYSWAPEGTAVSVIP